MYQPWGSTIPRVKSSYSSAASIFSISSLLGKSGTLTQEQKTRLKSDAVFPEVPQEEERRRHLSPTGLGGELLRRRADAVHLDY